MAVKYSLITSLAGMNMYTAATLKSFLNELKMIQVQENDADYIFVSMCDPDDLPILINARKNNPDKIIIMGGFESWFGNAYLAWADYIVVGEGYNFFKTLSVDFESAIKLPEVLSNEKKIVIPSYNVNYDKMPLVKMPRGNRYYYLASRGCHKKCKFCATSWSQPYSENIKSKGLEHLFTKKDSCLNIQTKIKIDD